MSLVPTWTFLQSDYVTVSMVPWQQNIELRHTNSQILPLNSELCGRGVYVGTPPATDLNECFWSVSDVFI